MDQYHLPEQPDAWFVPSLLTAAFCGGGELASQEKSCIAARAAALEKEQFKF